MHEWWSWRLAMAIVARAETRVEVRILGLCVASPTELEITFLPVGARRAAGIRLSESDLRAAGSRLSDVDVEQLALDVVVIGLAEPREVEPGRLGGGGVQWLGLTDWAE